MNLEQKAEYRKLQRQVGEAYAKIVNAEGYRMRGKKPNLFNNRLQRMKDFLLKLDGDYSKNRFMKMQPMT